MGDTHESTPLVLFQKKKQRISVSTACSLEKNGEVRGYKEHLLTQELPPERSKNDIIRKNGDYDPSEKERA